MRPELAAATRAAIKSGTMDDGKDSAQYFVTCRYCGTQTRLSFEQLEINRPVKCRVCGAPLEIVPPPKRPAKKRGKRPCDYYLLHAERAEYEPQLEKKYRVAANLVCIFAIASGAIVGILMWLITEC